MEKKSKLIFLSILGGYFLLLGILTIIRSIYRQVPSQMLYACYIGTILIGIGIITRRSYLVLSQVYILAIPILIWDIDFVHWLIYNKPLWGITDYFFFDASTIFDKLVSFQHLYVIPLSIYATKLIGVKRNDAWKWSFIQIILTYVAVTLLSPFELNINCVFYSCIDISYGLPYRLVWFLISFFMTCITILVLNHFLFSKKRKNKMKHKRLV